MPSYDYRCRKCDEEFSVDLRMSEYDRKKVKCPKCKTTQVDRRFESVSVKTSKKS